MKTNPKRYFDVLDRAPRLALPVLDASSLRSRRRVESGARAFFSAGDSDWMALLRMVKRGERRTH